MAKKRKAVKKALPKGKEWKMPTGAALEKLLARPEKELKVIDINVVKRVIALANQGFVSGLGNDEPGMMCVEAAVSYAMGADTDDGPTCVAPVLRSYKISLNDQIGWDDDMSRGKGLKRIAIAQLGTNKKFRDEVFLKHVNEIFGELVKAPIKAKLEQALKGINQTEWYDLVKILSGDDSLMPGDLLSDAINDSEDLVNRIGEAFSLSTNMDLCVAAEIMVQALIRMKSEGSKYLFLVPQTIDLNNLQY